MALALLPIKTDRLHLRRFAEADLDAVAAYQLRPQIQRYLERPVRDRHDVAEGLALMCRQVTLQRPGDMLSLAIALGPAEPPIGQAGLRWSDATAGQAELVFGLDPRHTGRGYMVEALTAMLDLAFDHFDMHRVFARCDARSQRSARLLERLGMRLEAHYREHALFQGEWDEELHFALLAREWASSDTVRAFLQPPARDRYLAPVFPKNSAISALTRSGD